MYSPQTNRANVYLLQLQTAPAFIEGEKYALNTILKDQNKSNDTEIQRAAWTIDKAVTDCCPLSEKLFNPRVKHKTVLSVHAGVHTWVYYIECNQEKQNKTQLHWLGLKSLHFKNE